MKIILIILGIFFLLILTIFIHAKSSISHDLIGEWECEDMGDFEKYGFSLPAKIIFLKNKEYTETMNYHGLEMTIKGKYKLILSKTNMIELDVIEADGEGWVEYKRSINHVNASGLGLNHVNVRFPLAREGWKNTGPFQIKKGKLLMSVYIKDFDQRSKDLKDARQYKKLKKAKKTT